MRDEREALERALHQMRASEFNGMEYFGSRAGTPKEVCLAEVAASDVYVGVFGDRYGHVDPETGLSMTELEYRRALACGLPCLIYVRAQGAPARPEHAEADEASRAKLARLKEELNRSHVTSPYANPDNLATKVVIDLYNLFTERRLPSAEWALRPTELLPILSTRFDLEELKLLCFRLGVDFDDLRGERKATKAMYLILHMEGRKQFDRLVRTIREIHPDIDWS